MLPNVQQATIQPIISNTVSPGTLIYTDEYDIYARLENSDPYPHFTWVR